MCLALLLVYLTITVGYGEVTLMMSARARLSARRRLNHHIFHYTASDPTVCQGLLHLLGNWELLNGKQYVAIQTGHLLRIYLCLLTLHATKAAATDIVQLNTADLKVIVQVKKKKVT